MTAEPRFEDFMAASMPGLLRFGHVLCGDAHSAEELVQTALVKTYLRWGRIRHDHPVAYVRRTMVTTYTSWWRRRSRETPLTAELDVAVASDSGAYDDRDLAVRALSTLPAKQRAVLVLRYYEGLSEAEIAAALRCSTGTVKSHTSRAMHALRANLGAVRADIEGTRTC